MLPAPGQLGDERVVGDGQGILGEKVLGVEAYGLAQGGNGLFVLSLFDKLNALIVVD